VLVFRAGNVGRTTISLALTKGDVSAKALESRRFDVRVTGGVPETTPAAAERARSA